MKHLLFTLAGIALFLMLVGYYYTSFDRPSGLTLESESIETEFSPEVENSLNKRIVAISNLVSNNQFFISSIKEANIEQASLTEEEISERDKRWIESTGDSAFISEILNNEISRWLRDFQMEQPEYIEIFVTSNRGLNIGQTNITSDYYQADEEWWVESFAGGFGKNSHGSIEFDESAQSIGISLYIPVMESGRALGVVKVVIDLKAIEQDL